MDLIDPSNIENKSSLFVSNSKYCKGKGLFTSKEIKQDGLIIEIKGELIYGDLTNVHNPYALQLDFNKYIVPTNITRYINHSCEPNCKVEIIENKVYLRSIKHIKPYEELSYDYNTTEYDLGVDSFECQCGSKNCIGIVKGFKYLTLQRKISLQNLLLPYLKVLISLQTI